ncbi:CpsD/CapB family tyrosine-protein kinase [Listeria rocourtiae]|uniref:CpsD/CapB family tyrosine-protein kinase n=1 Tax=Listeria rocourtiae TaxID=647910 RepID=UPI00162A87F7|nr:CpsD/CapB family tyrosine-protein kinase [Listeria rocourtiae]MBC1605348.1 CpsD/CapB family tyrosine-protein kinase [Listeria rocourtiae]
MFGKRRDKEIQRSELNLMLIKEKLRTIQTNIQFLKADGQKIKTIVITSSNKGEGKTFVSRNLASSFVEQGKKTLLIDIDLHKPALTKLLGCRFKRGLSDALNGRDSLDNLILDTEEENLYFLPSGTIPPNPNELLGSQMMDTIIEYVNQQFDIIIFDSPPVNIINDVRIFSSLCDGVIFVTAYNKTRSRDIQMGIESLKKVDANVLGVLINFQDYSTKQKKNLMYYSK